VEIEIINTGNELLLGTTLNTHGSWIGLELIKMGLRVRRQVTIPDGEAISEELERALSENDVVIITGGLGPTSDDVTREETAKALNLELIEDEFALRSIEEFFSSRGKEMAVCNKKQALSPCGADVLPNHRGTAPGVYVPPRLGSERAAVFLLPGPPFELRHMFTQEVEPRLKALRSDEAEEHSMKVFSFIGVGESDFHQGVDKQLSEIEGLEVGYCARPNDLDLRLIGSERVIEQGLQIVLDAFGGNCYAREGESLEQVVIELAIQKGMKITTAESCTGGAIASERERNV